MGKTRSPIHPYWIGKVGDKQWVRVWAVVETPSGRGKPRRIASKFMDPAKRRQVRVRDR